MTAFSWDNATNGSMTTSMVGTSMSIRTQELNVNNNMADDTPLTPQMHTACRSVLGQINWLQSRKQIHMGYQSPEQDYLLLQTFAPSVRQSDPSRAFRVAWPLRGKTGHALLAIQMHPIATMKINHLNTRNLSFLQKSEIFVKVHRTREAHWSVMRRIRSPLQQCPQVLLNCMD